MNDKPEKVIADLEEVVGRVRTIIAERRRAERRAAFFRKLGVRTPKLLYKLHGQLVMRMFDGRGMRRRDRVALATVRWLIDRTDMLAQYGTLGDVFHFPRTESPDVETESPDRVPRDVVALRARGYKRVNKPARGSGSS